MFLLFLLLDHLLVWCLGIYSLVLVGLWGDLLYHHEFTVWYPYRKQEK